MKKMMLLGMCGLCAAVFAVPGGSAAGWDAALAEKNAVVSNNVKWIDGKFLPIEGRAFDDVKNFYDRLPSNVTTKINNKIRQHLHNTAGMKFRFVTDSRSLRIKWTPTDKKLELAHMPSTGVSGVDIYRWDKKSRRWCYVPVGVYMSNANGHSIHVGWAPGTPCLINLPLYNGIKSFELGIDPKATIKPHPYTGKTKKPVVFLGTSITHGACASRPGMAFVNIVGRELDIPVVNLGFSGGGAMEEEMCDHLARIDASCYVLDCLWNMGMTNWMARRGRNVDENYEPFIRRLRAKRPSVPIVMAERCDVTCAGPNPQDKFIRKLYKKLKAEGWKHLVYLPKDKMYSGDLDGSVDGVHPSDLGMRTMADAFGGAVREALGE